MTRTYTMTRRAERQAETRQRIVEAAIALHGTVGPAQTTISMVAERAGVQRHTLYAHFPDDRSLLVACSGSFMERDPLPDADAWRAIADQQERLRKGLLAIYDWYSRNARLVACVLRDAEHHAPTKEVVDLHMGPSMTAYHEVLGSALSAQQRPILYMALSFFTWRTLTQDAGLKQKAAVKAMVQAIASAASG